jgi:uncharacterized membrane protein (UPF0127 family)
MRPKRRHSAAIMRLLFIFAMALALAGQSPALAETLASFPHGELSIASASGRHDFTVELALEPAQQEQGLMFRRTMEPNAGMLFVYSHPQEISMWMKNTILPLDMVFIGADGAVIRIAERTVPQSLAVISSGGPAAAVLELNAGTAARLGIKPGDKVTSSALGSAR